MTAGGAGSDLAIELALDRVEAEVHAALAAHAVEHWRRCAGGLPGAPPWPALLGDAAVWRAAVRAQRDAADPSLRRRGLLLWRLCARARIDGDAAVAAAAATLRDRASAGRADVGDLGPLCDARNRAAIRLGHPDFHALALAFDEVTAAELDQLIGAAPDSAPDTSSVTAARDAIASDAAVSGVAAVSGTSMSGATDARVVPLALAQRLFARCGVEGAPRIDVVAHGGGRLARTFAIARGDVRIVLAPVQGARGLRRAMHELGHALHAMAWRDQPAAFAAPAARCLDEAIAEWSAGLLEVPGTAAALLGLAAGEGGAIAADLAARRRRWQGWQRARAAFERDAHARPDGTLGARFRDLAARHAAADREAAERDAATVAPYIDDPGAQASYLVADALRAAIEQVDRGGAIGGNATGGDGTGCGAGVTARPSLRALLAAGASRSWRESLRLPVHVTAARVSGEAD
jgi:hypothetical protein